MSSMPANEKVSVGWQIVFAIISPINIWAFYRIKKLRMYVLYVIIPSAVISSIVIAGVFYEMENPEVPSDVKYPEPTLPPNMTPIKPEVGKYNFGNYMILNISSSVCLTLLSVYLVIRWSRQWNEQFPETQY